MLPDPAHLDSAVPIAAHDAHVIGVRESSDEDVTHNPLSDEGSRGPSSGEASRRIVGVRMRPDLQLYPEFFGQADQWGVKDPVTLEYFHLTDQEVAILRMLDGRTTVGDIQSRFEQRFAPNQLTDDDLRAFVAQLYRDGLVVVETPGQGAELFERRRIKRKRTRRQSWLNPLAIRLRGVDPHRFLDWLHDVTFWVFSPACVAACLALILSAMTLAVVRFETLSAKLPTFHEFFTADNLLLMALVLAVVKTLHEFGHALSCRHFGGECHELGVLFLVFTPCLYCNVSDSWMLPSRWQRVAVSIAGMYVEMVLASVCTFLWWFSEPGVLNGVCLQVMFVCSVATLIFNGNPLLRYDAYYVLSDVAGIPNLASQARTEVWGRIAALWLGTKNEPVDRPHRRFLLTYGIAATIYRWAVLTAILWFCHAVAKAHRLEILAHLLTIIVVMGVIAMPTIHAVKTVIDAGRKRRLRIRRFVMATSVLAVALFLLLTIPMPFDVAAAAVIAPADYDNVFVPIDGELISAVKLGTKVVEGDRLATLDNPKLKVGIQRLEAEVRERELHLKNLKARQLRDPRLESLVPTAEQQRDDAQRKLDQRRADLQQLVLTAPRSGRVLPAPWLSADPERDTLPVWQGTPLDAHNTHCQLRRGTLLCLIAQPDEYEATLIVPQSEVAFLNVGQEVAVMLDQRIGQPINGTVTKISDSNLRSTPRELAVTGRVATIVDPDGTIRPAESSYAVHVSLDVPAGQKLTVRSIGQAKISAAPQPLYARLYRYARRTFRFGLEFGSGQ